MSKATIWRHAFEPVAGHSGDDECTYRWDGADRTYCGRPEFDHRQSNR